MKKIGFIVLALIAVSCGDLRRTDIIEGVPGKDGSSGADGKDGKDGKDGDAGQDGRNGYNSLVHHVNGTALELPCGGATGFTFLAGTDLDDDSVLDIDEVTINAVVCNGVAGQDGATGATGPQGIQGDGQDGVVSSFTPVIVIETCGHDSSPYKEALLGLQGGAVFGSFSKNGSAQNVRNTLIPNGSYQNTDDSACNFSVTTDGAGNRWVTWGAQTTANGYNATAGGAYYDAATQTWTQN